MTRERRTLTGPPFLSGRRDALVLLSTAWKPQVGSYMDNIEHYKLDVALLSPVHGQLMTYAEALAFVEKGKQRVLQRCADTLAKGEYIAGCPAFFPRR